MSKLNYRNSVGELKELIEMPSTQVKNEFASVLDRATHGSTVVITRHAIPKAVLVPYAEFESSAKARSQPLAQLEAEFDSLLMRMQTPKAKRGTRAAFNASPTQISRAAVKQARKKR